MRRPLVIAVVLALGLVSSACSGAGSGDDDAGDAATETDETPAAEEVTFEPRSVTLHADRAAATTTSVGPGGGVIGATGADGTDYTLIVPDGALAAETPITISPLTGIDGLPDGSDAVGVQLEPSGLVFTAPAWLYLSAPDGVDVEDIIGIGIDDDGNALPKSIGFDGERLVMPIAHFSGGAACFPRCGGPSGWGPTPGGGNQPQPPAGHPGGGPLTPTGDIPPWQPPTTPPGPGPDSPGGGTPPRDSLTDGLTPSEGGGESGDLEGDLADAVGDLGDAQLRGDEEGERKAEARLDKLKAKVRDKVWNLASQCIEEKDVTKLRDLVRWVGIGQALGYERDAEA
jgi:hypothetical protein